MTHLNLGGILLRKLLEEVAMFRRIIAMPAVLSLAAALLAGASFAPAAQALDCGMYAHPTASGTCEPNSTGATGTQTQVPTNTEPTKQMMSCWDGSQVPMGSACPVAPAPQTQTQTQTNTQPRSEEHTSELQSH